MLEKTHTQTHRLCF